MALRSGSARAVAGLLVAASLTAASLGLSGCTGDEPWNVLLVTFDTTRADHLGPYGHPAGHTPHLDRLAQDGFVFERAQTAVPLTCPSHSTILTGTYPIFHGVRDNSHFVLPAARTTIAEVLRSKGYATGAAIGAFPLLARFGLDQGFDHYDDDVTRPYEDLWGRRAFAQKKLFFDERPAGEVNEALLAWLRPRIDRPFFAWAHYFDPHQPLTPPAPYDQTYASDPYLGELAYADESLGQLLAELEAAGVLDRTLVVVAADHGEGRGEHDEATHALLAYETTLHVPLVLKVPGRSGAVRIAERVGTVDILPTVLDLLGFEIPADVQGRSLAGLLGGGGDDPPADADAGPGRRAYYAETLAPRLMHGWGELRALYRGPLKYVHGPRPELFDVVEDPGERFDLSAERVDERSAMKRQLETFIREGAGETASAIASADSETTARLAALGYLSSSGEKPQVGPEALRDDGAPPQDHVGDITLMSHTKSLLHEERYAEALRAARRLGGRDPGSPFYLGLQASALSGLGLHGEAMELLDGVEEPVAYMSHVFHLVGLEAFRQGDRERGLDVVRRMVEAHGSAEGHYILAGMYEQLGDEDAYVEALSASLELDATFAPARLNIAILLARDGHLEQAEVEMRRTLDDSPLYPLAHFNYARLLGMLERDDEALSHLRRAIELRPTYWQAALAEIALLLDLRRVAEATAVFERVRRDCLDPAIVRQARALMESA
ncbi:MAG: sulfatase-like hydrolase/transferase [Acidobacteriota bacterium]